MLMATPQGLKHLKTHDDMNIYPDRKEAFVRNFSGRHLQTAQSGPSPLQTSHLAGDHLDLEPRQAFYEGKAQDARLADVDRRSPYQGCVIERCQVNHSDGTQEIKALFFPCGRDPYGRPYSRSVSLSFVQIGDFPAQPTFQRSCLKLREIHESALRGKRINTVAEKFTCKSHFLARFCKRGEDGEKGRLC